MTSPNPEPNPVVPHAPGTTQGFQLNHPTIISLLYLASFLTGITAIIGVVLGYLWKDENKGSWAESHLQYLVRTFWIGLLYGLAIGVSMILIVTIPLVPVAYAALAVWFVVRSLKALLSAQKQQPIADPTSWII